MLGANGQSNGCVSFRDYAAFLRAYQNGPGPTTGGGGRQRRLNGPASGLPLAFYPAEDERCRPVGCLKRLFTLGVLGSRRTLSWT